MKQILAELSKYPVATQLSLDGTIIVGRDIAHAKFKELLDAGNQLRITAGLIFGIKKTQFASTDYATVTFSTYET